MVCWVHKPWSHAGDVDLSHADVDQSHAGDVDQSHAGDVDQSHAGNVDQSLGTAKMHMNLVCVRYN